MIEDSYYKKGDFVKVSEVKKKDKYIEKGKTYQISHSVLQAHDKISIYVTAEGSKIKRWTLIGRDQVEKVS